MSGKDESVIRLTCCNDDGPKTPDKPVRLDFGIAKALNLV